MVGRLVRLASAGALLAAASCGTTEIYRWGGYEPSIAAMYATSSGYDPAKEIARLAEHIEVTQHQGKLVPPGMRAHVGYLLIEAGNAERGVSLLEAEKVAFPESAAFIDGMLARLRKAQS